MISHPYEVNCSYLQCLTLLTMGGGAKGGERFPNLYSFMTHINQTKVCGEFTLTCIRVGIIVTQYSPTRMDNMCSRAICN